LIDFDEDVDHPLTDRLLQTHLIESPCVRNDSAALQHLNIDCHPLLDHPGAIHDGLHNRVDVLALSLGKEPDVTEIDSQERHIGNTRQLRTAQDRAITTEHNDELAPVSGVFVGGNNDDVDPLKIVSDQSITILLGDADLDTSSV